MDQDWKDVLMAQAISQIQEETDRHILRVMDVDRLCTSCMEFRSERPDGHPCPICLASDVMED